MSGRVLMHGDPLVYVAPDFGTAYWNTYRTLLSSKSLRHP